MAIDKDDIIFEDECIIVLNKASGIYTIPDRWKPEDPNLYIMLKEKFGNIFTVHRLDRDTSGVILFAKDAKSHKQLNQQFQDHTAKRIYHVIVAGILEKDEMDIDIPLMDNPGKKGTAMPSLRGKESLTRMKVIEKFRNSSLIECSLVTGRHHQIRAHCSAIGHPLLVDEIYGNAAEFYLSSIKRKFNLKKHTDEKALMSRVSMHAVSLSVVHPHSGEEVTFDADYPKDFKALLQVLKKYSSLPDYYNRPSVYNFDTDETDDDD